MSNRIQLDEIRAMPVGEIAALPAEQLALLQEDAEAALTAVKKLKEWLDVAIALRFGERAHTARRDAGKDTGTVRLVEDGVIVVADLPKRVEWDQAMLAGVVERIGAEGDDPAEYVDTAFKVSERKYAAWPRAIRAAFERRPHGPHRQARLQVEPHRDGGRVMSGLPIISADERLAERRGIKGCIFGKSGIGKTSLLVDAGASAPRLFFDLEAGDLAIEGWAGDTIRPRTWSECRDFAVFIGGPNPALRDDQAYSQAHFDAVTERFGDPAALDRYETVFIDSITVAGRLCFQWCKGQPQAFSDRNGKPDMRGAYGLHGQEMIAWLTHLQHTRDKNVWFVGILDEKLDDFNRRVFSPQIEGSKTGNELPGIVDEVVVMAEVGQADADPYRAFVCRTLNPFGYPAKDRSGRLDAIEEPHLGRLMTKIGGPVRPASERLEFGRPAPAPAGTPSTPQSETQEERAPRP